MRGAKVPQHPDSDKGLARQSCRHGDPFCPCQDGDLCHYEGSAAWPTGRPELHGYPARRRQGCVLVSACDRDAVVSEVASRHRLRSDDILGDCRRREVTAARWECVWLLRARSLPNGKPKHSYPAIARALNMRNHTSALYAERRYRELLVERRVAA